MYEFSLLIESVISRFVTVKTPCLTILYYFLKILGSLFRGTFWVFYRTIDTSHLGIFLFLEFFDLDSLRNDRRFTRSIDWWRSNCQSRDIIIRGIYYCCVAYRDSEITMLNCTNFLKFIDSHAYGFPFFVKLFNNFLRIIDSSRLGGFLFSLLWIVYGMIESSPEYRFICVATEVRILLFVRYFLVILRIVTVKTPC